MRTIMNYQYRYGGGMVSSAKKLYNDGGMKRYYAGLGAALYVSPQDMMISADSQIPSPSLSIWRYSSQRWNSRFTVLPHLACSDQDCRCESLVCCIPDDIDAYRYPQNHPADSGW
jgi:hypothetical protein